MTHRFDGTLSLAAINNQTTEAQEFTNNLLLKTSSSFFLRPARNLEKLISYQSCLTNRELCDQQ